MPKAINIAEAQRGFKVKLDDLEAFSGATSEKRDTKSLGAEAARTSGMIPPNFLINRLFRSTLPLIAQNCVRPHESRASEEEANIKMGR